MAYLVTKKVEAELKKIAAFIPADQYIVHETKEISGEDVKLSGLKVNHEGEIIEDKTYLIDSPAFYPVNHFRRLKKAYQNGGEEAVNSYVNKYIAKSIEQQNHGN